jgi:alpha-glucosidase (family GH31 glycosyl hydrolase)
LTYTNDGKPFSKQNLNIQYAFNNTKKTWSPGLEDTKNLKGTTRTLDGANGGKYWDGKDIELEDGIISQSGFSVLDDSQNFLLDNSDWQWVKKRISSESVDWYFFGHGLEFKKALHDYTKIAGKIPMLPKYAFGYWWSRYWVYSDTELRDLISDFRTYDVPIDVLVIDMDWHETFGGLKDTQNPKMDETGNWLGWTGYTWNKSLFPNPDKFLDWTNKNYLKTALNLHPASGIAPMEDVYEDFAKSFGFDANSKKYIHYQMANKKWAETYFDVLLRPFENQGIDFWWLDWQQYPESKVVSGLSNTWWINYTFFTDAAKETSRRPMIFHRWGGMGNHRYPIGFSGDDKISWGSLKYQTYFTSTAANVGYGYWSHDIGGHASSELDRNPELYVRWLQFGVFSPILRTHSAKISSIERRFWKYSDHFKTMKELVQLRYSLAPYIYNNSRKAYDTGISLLRPMYYEHADNAAAYEYKYQYYFGDDMIVAPISKPNNPNNQLASKSIWLPEGEWYEQHSGSVLQGGVTINRKIALDEIPVYLKAGSIIPMYPKVSNLQQSVNHLNLQIVPGNKGETELYEDDGISNNYTQGAFSTTKIRHYDEAAKRMIAIEPTQGTYENQVKNRSYTIELLRSFPPVSVSVNGKNYPFDTSQKQETWTYNGRTLSASISIPKTAIKEKLNVEIHYNPEHLTQTALLNQKALLFRRISKIVGDMKVEVARKNWWSSLPNALLGAEQTPTRIQYNPTEIISLLKEFEVNLSKIKPLITQHKDARKEVGEKLFSYLAYE